MLSFMDLMAAVLAAHIYSATVKCLCFDVFVCPKENHQDHFYFVILATFFFGHKFKICYLVTVPNSAA